MKREAIDAFALGQSESRRAAVADGTRSGVRARKTALERDFADPHGLRRLAAKIKQHALDHLDVYLERAAEALERSSVRVHFAADGESARRTVAQILEQRNARRVVKMKTMLGEEIGLAAFLHERGIECIETDLGELVVQLADDRPSHIVKPIIHKNRREVAETFESRGLGPYDDMPEVITRRARRFLRAKYMSAHAAITGANFVSAESGRLVLVTNEGNSRFSLAATRCHIAIVGIEKVVATDRDLGVLLNLLARSATGQGLTVYTEFLRGSRGRGQVDGPDEMHVVFVDNGRSDILAGSFRQILRCIRCGACQNVCPVYRQASGHAYRAVYGGPIGAVLSPLLGGGARSALEEFGDLPRASTLCGACHEACPVDIPIEDLLVRLRSHAMHAGVRSASTPPLGTWSRVASEPAAWNMALLAGQAIDWLPSFLRPAAMSAWDENHERPAWRGAAFRRWWTDNRGRS